MAVEFLPEMDSHKAIDWLRDLVSTYCGPSDNKALDCVEARIKELESHVEGLENVVGQLAMDNELQCACCGETLGFKSECCKCIDDNYTVIPYKRDPNL